MSIWQPIHLSKEYKESEFSRGYKNGKEAIKKHGFINSIENWEKHNTDDDYDAGFKKALDDHQIDSDNVVDE